MPCFAFIVEGFACVGLTFMLLVGGVIGLGAKVLNSPAGRKFLNEVKPTLPPKE